MISNKCKLSVFLFIEVNMFEQIKLVLPGMSGSVLDDSGALDQVEWCPVFPESRVHREQQSTVLVVINSPSECE